MKRESTECTPNAELHSMVNEQLNNLRASFCESFFSILWARHLSWGFVHLVVRSTDTLLISGRIMFSKLIDKIIMEIIPLHTRLILSLSIHQTVEVHIDDFVPFENLSSSNSVGTC